MDMLLKCEITQRWQHLFDRPTVMQMGFDASTNQQSPYCIWLSVGINICGPIQAGTAELITPRLAYIKNATQLLG